MANYELSNFYEKTVLKPDEEVLERLKEEALAAEDTEYKKLFVSLGELYKEVVLQTDDTIVMPVLTEDYVTGLDEITDAINNEARKNPTPKPKPHRLSINQRRAIFNTMAEQQIMEARAAELTKNTYNKAWADKTYAEKLQASLGLEPGMDSPADGGGNVDIDYISYIQTANITDPFARNQLFNFITGAKALGIWQNIVCWPLRLNQNIQTGNTVYSLGGFGTYNGTLVNAPTRELNGMYFQSANSQYISTTLGNTVTAGSNYGLFCCADYSQVTSTTGSVVVAGGQRDLFNSGSTQANSPSIIIGATNSTNIRIIADPGVNPILSVNTTAPTSGFAVFSALSNGTNVVINQNLTQLSNTAPLVPTPIGNNLIIGCTQNNQKFFNGRIQFVLAAFCPVDNTALYNLYQSTLGSGELDAPAYFARAGVTDPTAQSRITNFVTGIKNLGLWYNMVAWPMRQSLNTGSGSTVYSLGGYGTYNGTLNGSASWTPGGITFTSNSDYIDYGTFNVAVSSGGFNIHTMFSGMGVPTTDSATAADAFYMFADSSFGTRYYMTNGVGGSTTWQFQGRNFNGTRIYGTTQYQSAVAQDIGASFIADYINSPTLSANCIQINGSTVNVGFNAGAGAGINGNYVMRTVGRNNTTNTPYPNSRISYLLAFQPGIGMTSQTMSAVYTLCQNTLNQGDADVEAYIAATGASDTTISTFVSGIKAQGLWYNMVSWPLISTQNKGFGSVVYSLGGLYGTGAGLSGTLVNGASWSLSGVNFTQSQGQYITTNLPPLTANTSSVGTSGIGTFDVYLRGNRTGSTAALLSFRTTTNSEITVLDANNGYVGTIGNINTSNNGLSSYNADPYNTLGAGDYNYSYYDTIAGSAILGSKVRQVRWSNAQGNQTIENSTAMTTATSFQSDGNLYIGYSQGRQYQGTVPFISMFNTSLSGNEAYLYNLYKTTLGANLTPLA